MENALSQSAMAFYHDEGLVPAWKHAAKFAGPDGRIGTMLDVVDARIASSVDDFPWNTYFTTASAEYFGYSRGGKRILIVAHGVGKQARVAGGWQGRGRLSKRPCAPENQLSAALRGIG